MTLKELKTIVPFHVSKWIKIPLLIDADEMEDLITNHLPFFKLYDIQRVSALTEGIYEPQFFLKHYRLYIEELKQGRLPSHQQFRPLFSMAWSLDEEAIYTLSTTDGRRLLKAAHPVVQTQSNDIRYSHEEKGFLTQIFSSDTLTWGVQIGFPFLFMDPTTYQADKTRDFPNMALFTALQQWVRHFTSPTPFIIEGKRINSPIRLGKKCFSWINKHPQLAPLNIQVANF